MVGWLKWWRGWCQALFFPFSIPVKINPSHILQNNEAIKGSYFKYSRSCMSAFWSRHVGAAAGCCLKALLSEWCVPFGGNAGAAAGCRCKVLLEGAAVRVVCALWSGHAGPAAGCCSQSWCVHFEAGMLMLLQGAAARRVLLSRWGVRFGAGMPVAQQGAAVRVVRALWSGPMQVPLQGAAWGCCRSSGVCAFKLVPLQGDAWGCCCQSGASALERACWCRCRVLLLECRVCFGAGLLVLVEGAGGGCCCRVLFQVLLSELRALWSWVQALRGAAVRAMCGFWSCNESGDDWRNAFWDTFLGCIFLGWPECKKYTFSPYFLHAGQPRKMHPKNAFFGGKCAKATSRIRWRQNLLMGLEFGEGKFVFWLGKVVHVTLEP